MPVAVFVCNELPIVQHLYGAIPWFDHVMHTLGGCAIAVMFYSYLTETRSGWWKQTPRMWRILLMISFVMLFGVAWEWYEFIHDYLFGSHYQLGVADTMFDLLFDGLGSIITSLALSLRKKI